MNEHADESFRAQVDRLVAEGKLTPEEAAGLLEGAPEPERPQEVTAPPSLPVPSPHAAGETPPDLRLEVSGYTLQIVEDGSVAQPELHGSEHDRLRLEATPQGWRVSRRPGDHAVGWNNLRAILTVPFVPRHVSARVEGGQLTLPDIGGEMQAEVNGGNLRMGDADSLQADVNGGNLTAGEVDGPANLNVNGGNLNLERAGSLNASVNGGNLRWAGQLASGNHRVEVNAGNATLHLLPGSSVQLDADVTVGAFKADFSTHKSGGFLNTRHHGQVGSGEARLSCRVAAGQVRVVTQ